jgi:hypothetical protein
VRGDQDDGGTARAVPRQVASHVEAALAAEHDVDEHHVGPQLRRPPQRIGGIRRQAHHRHAPRSRSVPAACRKDALSSTIRHRSGTASASHPPARIALKLSASRTHPGVTKIAVGPRRLARGSSCQPAASGAASTFRPHGHGDADRIEEQTGWNGDQSWCRRGHRTSRRGGSRSRELVSSRPAAHLDPRPPGISAAPANRKPVGVLRRSGQPAVRSAPEHPARRASGWATTRRDASASLRSSPLPSRPSSLRLAATDDELDRLPEAIDHSRRALRVMRQNVGISLATKVLFVVLAPIGFVSLILAVAVDTRRCCRSTTRRSTDPCRRPTISIGRWDATRLPIETKRVRFAEVEAEVCGDATSLPCRSFLAVREPWPPD